MTKCGFIKSLSRTTQGNCHCKRSGGKNPSEARLFLLVLHPRCEVTDELLSLVDVLVDGRFVEELHDISLRFRGSSNQRIIDVPRTLSSGGITLWEDQ